MGLLLYFLSSITLTTRCHEGIHKGFASLIQIGGGHVIHHDIGADADVFHVGRGRVLGGHDRVPSGS